jgi:hypothetical protein
MQWTEITVILLVLFVVFFICSKCKRYKQHEVYNQTGKLHQIQYNSSIPAVSFGSSTHDPRMTDHSMRYKMINENEVFMLHNYEGKTSDVHMGGKLYGASIDRGTAFQPKQQQRQYGRSEFPID